MKNDERRTIKLLCILGIVPVVWLALLIAVLEDGSHFHSYRNLMTGEDLGQVSYYPSDGVWRYQKGNDVKEITEAEAFEIMNSYAHVELPEMKPVKDFPMN